MNRRTIAGLLSIVICFMIGLLIGWTLAAILP